MSFRPTALKRSLLTGLLVGLAALPVAAQAVDSPIAFVNRDAILVSLLPTPSIVNSNAGSSSPMWLKVEFHYGVMPKKGENFLDEVQFKVWIEGLDLLAKDAPVPGKGVAVGLTGQVTYVNIPAGKDEYGVVYVHPNTLARYASAQGPDDFTRKFNVHVEAYVGGAKMDYFDKNKEQDPTWFTLLRPVPNLIYRQDQCPFMMADPDKYPAIKLPALP